MTQSHHHCLKCQQDDLVQKLKGSLLWARLTGRVGRPLGWKNG